MRTAFIRVSATNIITKDNEELKVKAGEVIEYQLKDVLNIIDEWLLTKKFNYFIIEHHNEEDSKHWHIVLDFPKNSTCNFKTLKNKFPYGFIDTCRTGVKNCVRYLCHADNPEKAQYSWDEIITNSPDKLETFKIPGNANVNIERQKIVDKIISGEIKEFEVNKIAPDIYIKYKNAIKNAFEYRQQILVTNPNRDVKVYVLQGPPRIGKSTFCKVWAKENNKSICFSSASRDAWQDYAGQDVFVYDDFDYSVIKIDDFKKALDPHTNSTVSRRYRNALFTGDTIFICTNTPIEEWYKFDNDLSRQAIFKRISFVLEFFPKIEKVCSTYFENEGVVKYVINKIDITKDFFTEYDKFSSRQSRIIKLIPIGEREFDLNKYIDIDLDGNKDDEFLSNLDKI